MTENEAIEFLKGKYPLWGCDEDEYENAQIAIQALEEIQQYRAIGTVEEVKSIVYIGKWGYKKGYNEAIDEFAEKLSLEISESIIWDMLATMSKNGSLSDTSDEIVDYVIETSKKIAEQMKAGVTVE